MLILIIIIILVIGLVYYKYFYYSIEDDNIQQQEKIPIEQEQITTEQTVSAQTNYPSEQNCIELNNHSNILNYLENENKLELSELANKSEASNNLLYRYVNLNEIYGTNNINNQIMSKENTNLEVKQNKCSTENKTPDILMSLNNLKIEYPEETNLSCKKITNLACTNPNLINNYIASNSNCDNFQTVDNNLLIGNDLDNTNRLDNTNIFEDQNQIDDFRISKIDFLNSRNIINALTRFKKTPSGKENFSNYYEMFSPNNIQGSNLNKTSRIIWIYWENINRNKYPTFIKLCIDSMKKHLGIKYNLIFLNEKTVKNYLSNLRDDFDNLKIAQKVDYYRIALLHKYGGIWIDADIIVMRDFDPIFQKLDEGYDYVGFGCTGYECDYGYFRPSNWVMGAKKNSILMAKCLEKLNKKLDSRNKNQLQNDSTYHDYGKIIIWDSLDELKSTDYNYYHFTSEHDGARDKNKNWIHVDNFFSTNNTQFLNESKLLFVVLYNSEMSSDPKYKWIYDCDESRLLYGNEWLCSLYRKSLNIQ